MGRSARRRGRELEARLEAQRERYGIDDRSLSLRHMAENGITPSGSLERLGYEVQMARTPGWRGRRWLQAVLVLALVTILASLVLSLVSSFRATTMPPDVGPPLDSTVPADASASP